MCREGPGPEGGRPGVQQRRGRAGAGELPGVPPDRPARRRGAVRGLHGRRTSTPTPVTHVVVLPDGTARPIEPSAGHPGAGAGRGACAADAAATVARGGRPDRPAGGRWALVARRRAAGTRAATRTSASGCAPTTAAWLAHHLTVDALRELLPEAADLAVTRHLLPNLRAVNFVIDGLLGDGVAAQARFDPQAQGASASGCARATSTSRRHCCEPRPGRVDTATARRCWTSSRRWTPSTRRRWPGAGRSTSRGITQRGKLLARERIELLLDPDSPFLELSPLAAWGSDFTVGASVVTGDRRGRGRRVPDHRERPDGQRRREQPVDAEEDAAGR